MTQTTLDIGPKEDAESDSQGLLAVFLYRSDLGKSPLYGEMREVQQHTSRKVVGVATRPPGEPICNGGTRWEDEFVDEVEETAIQWEWLDTELRT